MWEELGISGGTAIIILAAFYFVIKWAVRKGIMEAHQRMEKGETAQKKYTVNYFMQKLMTNE